MSIYAEVMIEIDKMLEGTRFFLREQPQIINWSNGVEVKLTLKESKSEDASTTEPSDAAKDQNGLSK